MMTHDGGAMVGAGFKPAPTWDLKIERCKVLAERYTFAREILDFYQKILVFQKRLYEEIKENKHIRRDRPSGLSTSGLPTSLDRSKDLSLRLQLKKAMELLLPYAPSLLPITREGTPLLATMAKEVSSWGQTAWEATLEDYQRSAHRAQPLFFFPRTLLQPYLQFVLEGMETPSTMGSRCPFCGHRPQVGCLRPMDNASQRFLICSFCHGEWPYQRLSCPNCTESDKTKLSYLVAEGWPAVRLDTCETCRQYIKTIDLGRDPEAVPVVDELATIPLDVWAREKGYEKMELNLAGI